MRKLNLWMTAAAVLLLALSAHVRADHVFVASFDGSQETPPNMSPGKGMAVFVLDADMTELHWAIRYEGLEGTSVNAAHFHNGAFGVAGPIVRAYDASEFSVPDGFVVQTWADDDAQSLTADLVEKLFNGELYFNVHTMPDHPAGEIRGQIYYFYSF